MRADFAKWQAEIKEDRAERAAEDAEYDAVVAVSLAATGSEELDTTTVVRGSSTPAWTTAGGLFTRVAGASESQTLRPTTLVGLRGACAPLSTN